MTLTPIPKSGFFWLFILMTNPVATARLEKVITWIHTCLASFASKPVVWTYTDKICLSKLAYSSVFTGIPRNPLSYWFIQCCRYRELQLLSIKYLNEWTGWRWITGAHRPKVRSWPPRFRTWFRTFKLSIVCFVNFLIKNWWKIRFLVTKNAICVFINLIKYFVILNILTQLWIRMRFIYRDNSDRVSLYQHII